MSATCDLVAHIQDSSLGWLGVAYSLAGVRRVTFGHSSRTAARKFLTNDLTRGTRVVLDWSDEDDSLMSRLQDFADGAPDEFRDVKLDDEGISQFHKRVLEHCRRIAYGDTLSYGELAQRAGNPRAARAVGSAMAANRWPLIVPCHRVVQASGNLGNYSAPQGIRMKRRLIEMESAGVLV